MDFFFIDFFHLCLNLFSIYKYIEYFTLWSHRTPEKHYDFLAINKLEQSCDHTSRLVYCCYYLPLITVWPFIETNLNPLHPRMLCAKFGWYGPGFLEKKIINAFLLFHYHLPMEEDNVLRLNKPESHLLKDLCAKFGWIWPSGFWENEISCRWRDGQTDDKQQAIRKRLLSSELKWTKNKIHVKLQNMFCSYAFNLKMKPLTFNHFKLEHFHSANSIWEILWTF